MVTVALIAAEAGDAASLWGGSSGDPTDRVAVVVGGPQASVGAGRDPGSLMPAAVVAGDLPGGGDPADRVVADVGEPQSTGW